MWGNGTGHEDSRGRESMLRDCEYHMEGDRLQGAITPRSSKSLFRYFPHTPLPLPIAMSQLSFKGHTVIVTGAGGGLGKA